MDERTRAYLRGRFSDYYRRLDLATPPAADRREWGYIPWTAGPGTTMVRHKSLLELGDPADFLRRERPQHVYYSAGRYRSPGAGSMDAKGWQGSDLVFDLDADHLPAVDPESDTYAAMLAACKDELWRLLDFLEDDFAFEDLAIVFSGSRGYHVHVRDETVRGLDRTARREIVDYVRGIGVEFGALVRTETAPGSTATRRVLETDGGWGRRLHARLVETVEDVTAADPAEARDRLRAYNGIGEKRAATVLETIRTDASSIASGELERGGPAIRTLASALLEDVIDRAGAAIDEPVTTDIHRLIRLPGSLHGGTALVATPIDRAALEDFDPLVDAVPSAFTDHEIRIRSTGGPPVDLGGETFRVPAGETTMPEHVAMFLMARGRAEKERE